MAALNWKNIISTAFSKEWESFISSSRNYGRPAFFKDEIFKTVERNKLSDLARVRLQIWNGQGGLLDAETGQSQFIVECFALDESVTQWNENGLIAGIASGLKKSMDALANLKSSNALIYAMAAHQARENKWNDSLIPNTDGHIIESTIANVFWIKDGHICTPNLEEGCIAGVMRRHLLSVKEWAIRECPLTPAALLTADEVFLTNSIRKIKWVKQIGDKSYGSVSAGSISQRLESLGYL